MTNDPSGSSGTSALIEFDTPFIGDDIYTRANAGEVFPRLISPLTWTLLGPAIEKGFMRCMAGDFAAVTPIEGGYLACGRMAGRLHLNLSVFRTVAERLPGSTARDLDVQYFGDAVASGLPAHPEEKVSLGTTVKCSTAALKTMATFGRRVRKETERARAATDARRAFLARPRTATELLQAIRGETAIYADLFGSHVTARALTSSAVSQATGALARKGMSEDEAMQRISNLPDLESAKPSKELKAIAAEVTSPLRAAIIDGLTWDELAGSELPGADRLREALHGFLEKYGHRGVNEFDPAWPVWGTEPDTVLSLLRRIAGTGTEQRPGPASAAVPGGPTRLLVGNARRAIHRAENTKDNIIRVSHNIRLLLDAAIAQLEDRLTREDALALTFEELSAVAAGGPVPTGTITRRRAEIDRALRIQPAEWSIHELSVVAADPVSGTTNLTGLPGSNGVAKGRVRIMRDVNDDFEDGEVLVATTTDTAWTPLFLAAGAVVTDTGGSLSHATIVAREIGIPAVVNTKTAVRDLQDGDLVEVDGTNGTVRILERSEQ